MRRKIVAGNWKMNLTKGEALDLYHSIGQEKIDNVSRVIFSPLLFLDALKYVETPEIPIGAQNFFPIKEGAFTGEVSYAQLKDLGIENVIIGHSERRTIFHEDDALIRQKVEVAIAAGLHVYFCCGESLEVRESGKHFDYVLHQLTDNLFHLEKEKFSQITIAYEPIWAIGTGKTATPEQAEEMHERIRLAIAQYYSNTLAESTSILYGGSCKPSNAKELFAKKNIDGGLIGGASLNAKDFNNIAKSF